MIGRKEGRGTKIFCDGKIKGRQVYPSLTVSVALKKGMSR